jgi:hypothetical protein
VVLSPLLRGTRQVSNVAALEWSSLID